VDASGNGVLTQRIECDGSPDAITLCTGFRRGAGMLNLPAYVLITPARNEAEFIQLTLKSVVSQTIRPVKWVIVSDGSTDGTDDIVKIYAAEHSWIELVRQPERPDRHFAGKADAVSAGLARLKEVDYQVIGNLDADVSFDQDYFAFLISKFAENSDLGVGGTAFREGSQTYNYEFVGIEHVSGMCQMFRRVCFEGIGGYPAIKSGGIDLMAVLSARAKGWQTRTFTEKLFEHHRKMGTAQISGLRERFHRGRMDYLLGSHPVWEICRSFYQMKNRPFIIGGLLILAAYFWYLVRGVDKTMPKDLIALRQADQMRRLHDVIRRRLHFAAVQR